VPRCSEPHLRDHAAGSRPEKRATDTVAGRPIASFAPDGIVGASGRGITTLVTNALAAPPTLRIDLEKRVREIQNRWPAVGLAVGVVRNGRLEYFHGQGMADIESNTSITEDTVFRIASVTKTFTAIAVLQLWERGLVELDAPANDYLRTFKLVPAKAWFRPVTLRHLLTHTSGIREALKPTDLLRIRSLGEAVDAGRPVPTPARLYRGGLRFDADPGSRFMYTNHGFATLGQVVEDVTGQSLARYFRENIFEPLGMVDTSLVRSELDRSRCATAYELGPSGPRRVTDYEVVTLAGGGVNSTPRDMARYLAALLGKGSGARGAVLQPATLQMMYQPHYQPDPRVPGIGLSFFRANLGGHAAVEHDGVLPGFDSTIFLSPDDGVGVMAFANGARRGMHWLVPEAGAILRELIGVSDDAIRTDVPQHPEIWRELCGWYHFSATLTDPGKLALGPGVEVHVRGGRLRIRALSAIPALYRGFVLHPDDDQDPYVFRIALPWFGIGTGRVIFSREPGGGVSAVHTDFGPLSFQKRPARTNPRRWIAGALGGLAVTGAITAVLRSRRRLRSG
jgi:CubicO group peptidase (beta-lactamase class C family)